jgi:ribosomal protein S18 acetylase RimI-like enzyme
MNLQAIAATGWGFQEREHIGGWELRAAGGHTARANCAWPLGDSGLTLRETLQAVQDWFAARGHKPRVQTVDGSLLDKEIAASGFPGADRPALRQVAPLNPVLQILEKTAAADREAEITAHLPEDYFTVYRRGSGIPQFRTILTTGDAVIRFAVVRGADGSALSAGRLAIDTATGYAGIAALATAETARRRGLSRVVLRDLLSFAADLGAKDTYLEVEEGNTAALALYGSLGYATVHRYHCRTPAT